MTEASIFDLLQPAQTPKEYDLRAWIQDAFPHTAGKSAFLLALQLERLFELAIFENRVKEAHMLLQQGIPPDIRWDWDITPLMCANYLGYKQLAELLITYGASVQAESFSGKKAFEFVNFSVDDPSDECTSILTRYTEIHDQLKAKFLKPCPPPAATGKKRSIGMQIKEAPPESLRPKKARQIDNGKGVDEIFKKILNSTE